MQKHVHQAQAAGACDNFVTVEGAVLDELLLGFVKLVVPFVVDEVVGGEEKAPGTTGGVGNGFARLGAHALDHGAN